MYARTIRLAIGTLLCGGSLVGFLFDAEIAWPLDSNSFPLQLQAAVTPVFCSYEFDYVG